MWSVCGMLMWMCVGTCLVGAQVGAGVVEAGVCVWLMLWDDGDGGDGREG